ncbi:hypothetical protein ABT061_34995 [Streptosporangium sp. NPDC002544]|uniref:hypothetical protein n=1 Tax=Streptosporangium sp. NPDC002544 TaxID=3154538 RepID=UPI00332990AD
MSKTTRGDIRRQRRREAAQARERRVREAARAAKAREKRVREAARAANKAQEDNKGIFFPVLLILLLVFGLPIFLISSVTLPDIQTALGMRGTPGTATVLSCEAHGSGRNSRRACQARFVFKASARPPVVLPTVADVEVGETFPAAINSEGDLVLPTGARGVWRWVPPAVSIFVIPAVLMIVFGFYVVRSWALGIGGIALALATAAAMIAGFALGG